MDYAPGPYSVTFPAREMSASFSIQITNDDIHEDDETFETNITLSSLPTGVTIAISARAGQASVRIVDDDSEL